MKDTPRVSPLGAITEVITALGLDPKDPNLEDTPVRIWTSYLELCSGLWAKDELDGLFEAMFPCTYDQMILAKDIDTVGLCPHHFMPVEYVIHIGYIPKRGGNVLGISKLARLARILAHRPVLQEQLTQDIADTLMDKLDPDGVGVVASGRHSCMRLRGVRSDKASIVTSAMTGVLRYSEKARGEFLELCKGGI